MDSTTHELVHERLGTATHKLAEAERFLEASIALLRRESYAD